MEHFTMKELTSIEKLVNQRIAAFDRDEKTRLETTRDALFPVWRNLLDDNEIYQDYKKLHIKVQELLKTTKEKNHD
jgi:hypothetical protein